MKDIKIDRIQYPTVDLNSKITGNRIMRRSELWRLQYRQDRYMVNLDNDQLNERFKDVLNNQQSLTVVGKLALNNIWMEMCTHLFEEYHFRGGIPTHLGKEVSIVNTTYPDKPKAMNIIEKFEIPKSGKFLIKLGKSKYLKDMFENGYILINPASYFSDPSLNQAQKDDELNLNLESHPLRLTISDNLSKSNIKPIGNVRYNIKALSDFYVYCMASTLEPRLFDDFNADSCILIHKPEEFCKNLIDSCKKQFRQDYVWRGFAFPINYIDPLNPPTLNLDIYFTKHFRYWYQREFRIAWLPQKPVDKLEPILVELGDIKRYCELFTF
jgi:hypothetical protein